MKAKTARIIFCVLFMLTLLMPLLFADFTGGKVSVGENRMLAARPPLSNAFSWPSHFIGQFGDWFSDNLGFRKLFIRLNRSIDARLASSGQYKNGQYVMLIGQEGHHFFADVDGFLIPKFQGQPFLSDDQLSGLANGLNSIKADLDARHIPLVVMLCADKDTIYPEYYPRSIRRGPDPNQLTVITQYLKDHTDADLFDLQACLTAAKADYPVFDKYSDDLEHYNELGAFFSYQELMLHIGAYFPEMTPLTIDDVNIIYKNRNGYDNIPEVRLKQEPAFVAISGDIFQGMSFAQPQFACAFENNDSSLPTILIIRDSYMSWRISPLISSFIPQHFGKTILIHWEDAANLDEYIARFQPDIVVLETAERVLPTFATTIAAFARD